MKKIISIICTVALAVMLCVTAYAAPQDFDYVWDYADVLTDSEEAVLDAQIETFTQSSAAVIFLITKQGAADYSAGEYAESFYENNSSAFTVSGKANGFVFVDDFDNDAYILYRIGEAKSYFDKEAVEEVYSYLDESYDSGSMAASYAGLLAFVSSRMSASTVTATTASTAATTAAAESTAEQTTEKYGADYDFSAPDSQGKQVVDWAELLTDEQEQQLLLKIEQLKETYKTDVVIHTTNSIGNKSITDYSDDFLYYNGYGLGADRDCVLFMLNMNVGGNDGRDYHTSTHGKAIEKLTDYAVGNDGYIHEKTLPYLSDGDYFAAFSKYLELIDVFLAQADNGEPYDVSNPYKTTAERAEEILITEAILIAIACAVAFVIVGGMKKKMKTAEIKKEAADYLKQGSLAVTGGSEMFSHRSVTQTAIPKSTSSDSGSSGGSSTHTGSSGSSFGGGGGKF